MRYVMLFLLGLSSVASADAYKCKGYNGNVVITATPCDFGDTKVGSAKSDGTDAVSYYQAQADLQRQKDWLAGREQVHQQDAVIAQQQAAAVDRAYPQLPQQSAKSESIWDRSWGCWWHPCSFSRTTTSSASGRR